MIVRGEEPSDPEAIDAIHRAAFGQADEAEIVARLRGSGAFIPDLSLVAEEQGSVVGHILFSKVDLDPPADVRMVSLAPMAVHPTRQRAGIGSDLVRRGLELAGRMGVDLVVVVGHPEYYPRFGFEPASTFGLRCPFPVPDDAFLVIRLRDEVGIPSGEVVYPPELGA